MSTPRIAPAQAVVVDGATGGWPPRCIGSARAGRSTVPGVETQELVCPRCGASVSERFYGPCGSCRSELRAKFVTEARVVELAEYVPKMNVTPNAVALKDD